MMIRSWEYEDIEALLLIEKECFSDPFSKNILESEFQSPHATYLVLEEEGEIIGYGGYTAVLDEADITTIGILPSAQGKGYGRLLLNALLEQAKMGGARSIWLEVRAGNVAAIGLYKSSGFREMGVRKGYYQDNGEDALTMMKEI